MSNLQRAQAEQSQQPEDRDSPSPFIGLGYEVDQILLGRNVMSAKVNAIAVAAHAIEAAYNARQLTPLKLAAERMDTLTAELRTIADQTNNLSAHMAKKIAELLARKPRA